MSCTVLFGVELLSVTVSQKLLSFFFFIGHIFEVFDVLKFGSVEMWLSFVQADKWSCFVIGHMLIGKVAVKKEDLQKYHGKDTWFQLQPVSADSEVQVSNSFVRSLLYSKSQHATCSYSINYIHTEQH